MNPKQSKKIAYSIIIVALLCGLLAFMYLIGKRKNDESSTTNTNNTIVTTTTISADKIGGSESSTKPIPPEILKKILEANPDVSPEAILKATNTPETKQAPIPVISQDVLKSLSTPKK
jgi:hypothetical protein